jgi:predicted site-specific integrase-resolvase
VTARLKNPDGTYPDVFPSGLVKQKTLTQHLGIAESTLHRWQKAGVIAPVRRVGNCALYKVPTEEEVAHLRAESQRRIKEAQAKGLASQVASGSTAERFAKGRVVKTEQCQQRLSEGLMTLKALGTALGMHRDTLKRWVEAGVIRPAQASGTWAWYAMPDKETLQLMLASAQGRSKTRLREILDDPTPSPSFVAIEEGLITTEEHLAAMGVSDTTLKSWVVKGYIPNWERKVGYRCYWRPLSPEEIETARALALEAKAANGQRTGLANRKSEGLEGLVSTREFVALLGISDTQLRNWIHKGYVTGPERKVGNACYWRPISSEQVGAIKIQARQFIVESGRRLGQAQREKSVMAVQSTQEAPEGCLSRAEAVALLGVTLQTFRGYLRDGLLVELPGKWIQKDAALALASSREELYTAETLAKELGTAAYTLRRQIAKGLIQPVRMSGKRSYFAMPDEATLARLRDEKGRPGRKSSSTTVQITKKVSPERPKTLVFPSLAPEVQPTPLKTRLEVARSEEFIEYDTAVKAGRANLTYQGPLGFNLWQHASLGFRAEAVNRVPSEGWRYHERHAKNGYGQWAIRAQRPATGEILL